MNRKPVLPDVWPTKYPAKSRISNVWQIGTVPIATSLILCLPCRMQLLSGGDGRWTWMSGKGVAPPRNRIDWSIRLLQGANPFREIIRSRGPLIYCTRAKYTRGRGSLWTRSSLRDSEWTSSSSPNAPPPPAAACRGAPQRRPFIRTGVRITKVA